MIKLASGTAKADNTPIKIVNEPVKMQEPLGHLDLNTEQVPEVGTWEPGEKYVLVIEVEQTSKRIPSQWQIEDGKASKGDILADFKILKAKAVNNVFSLDDLESDDD